jgi:CubicO group peptidase (beta-lactamase class C family)
VEATWGARLNELTEEAVARVRAPGFAIGVVHRGETAYARGYGCLELGEPARVGASTVFHMASVTKPFVATAIMQLVEKGRLCLEDKVARRVPYFQMADSRYREITVRQMLNHTAGMPDVEDYHWDRPEYDDASLERYIRTLTTERLIGAPGERSVYSNIGFEVLAAAIQEVAGQPFEAYVHERILAPIGMSASTLLMPRPMPGHWASPHMLDDSGEVAVQPCYPYNRPHAASSTLHSSVEDMLRWALANLNLGQLGARILSADSYDAQWSPSAELEPGRAVGLSWMLGERWGRRIVQHGGGDKGFSTLILLVPELELGVVTMSNLYHAVAAVAGAAWAAIALAMGREPEPIFPSRETIAAMAGRYRGPDGTVIEIGSDGDGARGTAGGARLSFVPVNATTIGAEVASRQSRVLATVRNGSPVVFENDTLFHKEH